MPLAVTGVDALGRPFQERTSTLVINCHGARYQSKHYVLKNMWVTLEIPQPEPGRQPRSLRGKVTWIQRPRTVRQLFQIAVELEMPGNFWGIAFPPEDWFPPAGSEITETAALANPELSSTSASENSASHSGEFSGDNLHVMPPPAPAAPGEASEEPPGLARQMNRLMAEAHQKIQAAAREAVTQAVTAGSQPLLDDLQARIKEAESAVQKAAAQAAEIGAEAAAAKVNEAQAAAFRALRAELPAALTPQIEQATQQLSTELAKAGTARFAAFDDRLQSALHAAQNTIDRLSSETRACLEKLQSSLQRFETDADERAQIAHLRWDEAARERFTKSSVRAEEVAHAERQLHDHLAVATEDAANNWRVRLEADLALASSRWEQTMENSIEAAANRAAENIEHRRKVSTDQLQQEWSARAEEIRNSMDASIEATANRAAELAARQAIAQIEQKRQASVEALENEWLARAEQIRDSMVAAVREAEGALASLHAELERETSRAAGSLAEMQQATSRGQEFAVKLEHLSHSTLDQVQSQLHSLASAEVEKLTKQTAEVISGASRKIQPLLETAGRESAERLAAEFEKRFGSQLERAREVLEKLAAAEKLPESLLRVHQEHLERISEQSRSRAVTRLEEDLTAVEKQFQLKVHTTESAWLGELEQRASEVQAAAADSLFKSAEWHQTRAESQVQASFEKKIEDVSAALREKAGEISGVFAAELDHYSRSYVAHSQSQLDEAVKETFERARGLYSEVAATTAAAFTDEIQRGAHGELDHFEQTLEKTSAESRAQMETEAERVQARLRDQADESFTDFQQRMASDIENGVVHAGRELEKQLEPVMQTWRTVTEKHQQQINETYERLGNESVESYKNRLENVSNSWMVATVSTLDRQSQEMISGVAKSAEEKLRETCSQVFAGVGETLRARLQEMAASLAPPPLAPEK